MGVGVVIATEQGFATLLVYKNSTFLLLLYFQWCWHNFNSRKLIEISNYISSNTMEDCVVHFVGVAS